MRNVFFIFCLNVFVVFNANAADQIAKILEANHGKVVGHSALYNESCQLQIYGPGEYTSDSGFYVEYTFENSPAYHIAPYPNNGMIFDWALNENKSTLIVYVTEDKKDYAQFSYDLETLKIQSFALPGMSCNNLK